MLEKEPEIFKGDSVEKKNSFLDSMSEKLKAFFNIGQNIETKVLDKTNNKKLSEIDKKIDTILSNDLSSVKDVLAEYMNSGYQLTSSQKKILYQKLYNVDDMSALSFFEKTCHLEIADNEYIANFFVFYDPDKNRHSRYYNEHETDSNKKIDTIFEKKIKEPEFQQCLFNKWLNNYEKINSAYYPREEMPSYDRQKLYRSDFNKQLVKYVTNPLHNYGEYILKNQSLTDILELNQKLYKKSQKFHLDSFNGYYYELCEASYKKVALLAQKYCITEIEHTKIDISLNCSLDNKINEQAKNALLSTTHKITELSKASQQVIENIKNEYTLLIKHWNSIDKIQQLEIDNIWNKKLPEVINKYLLLDDDYKNSMVHINGKNAEQLMMESLSNILDSLQLVRENRNENSLSDLSATNSYIKNTKKSL